MAAWRSAERSGITFSMMNMQCGVASLTSVRWPSRQFQQRHTAPASSR